LLSPAQLIATGAPEPIPNGLDHYKAYRVIDAPPIHQQVRLTHSVGPAERTLGKPLYVCLSVDEWHHEDHFAISHPNDCFVVYELDESPHPQVFSTIDQFGLNELKSANNRWLCVRAAFLGSEENQ
jgi:hypothetical protein